MQWLKFGDLCQLSIKFMSWSNSTISIAIILLLVNRLEYSYPYIYSSKHLLTATYCSTSPYPPVSPSWGHGEAAHKASIIRKCGSGLPGLNHKPLKRPGGITCLHLNWNDKKTMHLI